ncbi:MAG: AAA family ATPase [Halanaerobiales bacterium]|nr:AAA family ATPase [Halanaerobiales bacterium]
MKLPNNISDFKLLRRENYLYVDKTKYIEKLENLGRYLFFIRPRRFGKSLFLSTLANYYDLDQVDDFENLFGDLYIGKNSTTFKNSNFILALDFSGLDTSNPEELKNSFNDRVLGSLITFFNYYQNYFPKKEEIIEELKNTSMTRRMDILFNEVAITNYKIYVIIDEYDHFANDLVAVGDGEYYRNVIRASGFVRDFYEIIKIGTKRVIDRIFISGIAPLMLDDMTSGFNITSNITMIPQTNELLGFTEEEIDSILQSIPWIDNIKELMPELKAYYNGYIFNINAKKRIYNPNMIFYFLQQCEYLGTYPEVLVDENIKTDYARLNRLTMNENNCETLDEIIKNNGIVSNIVSKFSFDQMYNQQYFVSLLFYLGLLTIEKKIRTRLYLKIPNQVIKIIFWEYFERKLQEKFHLKLDLEELHQSIETIAFDGEIKPYIDYISQNVLQVLSNRDLIQFDEKYLKVILLTYLGLSNIYKISSEKEVDKGYIDIFLEKDIRFPDVKYEWIWELKYLKKSETNQLERVKKEGLTQLDQYAKSRHFKDKENLKKALIIFIGKDEYEIIFP